MDDQVTALAAILRGAGETHHQVYRLVDGEDADWASWYADWLIRLSRLPEVLGVTPVASELVYVLVGSDKEHTAQHPNVPWDVFYADRIITHFRPGSG
ncbi:hypothetical protein [Pseudonocardia alaniniphila]|uniref:Immunity protein 35 of polymorphic toxin system n=1 Tax=Pseudonocardia alaniniphila TaxID=75291 RepID=A0ABS9TJ34_9PSEU|nr:hypothetical protein [Pseudonocardia alaniniphila]MCH6168540.1 hypothetical protein [Pseudonocardia alaniniphila]